MKKSAALVALLLAVSCAPPAVRWQNPSLPKERWAADAAECRRWATAEAEKDYIRDQGTLGGDLGATTYEGKMAQYDMVRNRNRLFDSCMRQLGYVPAK